MLTCGIYKAFKNQLTHTLNKLLQFSSNVLFDVTDKLENTFPRPLTKPVPTQRYVSACRGTMVHATRAGDTQQVCCKCYHSVLYIFLILNQYFMCIFYIVVKKLL